MATRAPAKPSAPKRTVGKAQNVAATGTGMKGKSGTSTKAAAHTTKTAAAAVPAKAQKKSVGTTSRAKPEAVAAPVKRTRKAAT